MEIIPLGDSALVVRVREQFEDAPEETLDEVLRAFQLLQRAEIPSAIEFAPAYTSVAVFFDPIAIARAGAAPGETFEWLVRRISATVAGVDPRSRRKRAAARVI